SPSHEHPKNHPAPRGKWQQATVTPGLTKRSRRSPGHHLFSRESRKLRGLPMNPASNSAEFTPMNLPEVEERRASSPTGKARLLDPGLNLTLRPMRYPGFYDMYRDA